MAGDEADAADSPAAIMRDAMDVWLSVGKRWHGRSVTKTTWSPEDVVGDSTDLFEHLTPLVERGLNLTFEMLRPWATAFEERSS